MDARTERLLVVESDDAVREQVVAVLRDAGYDVSADYHQAMKTVLDFRPDAVVLGGDPPQLDCCGLLSEIKGSEQTQDIRVLMLSPGGSAERARAMDLGADDVLSLPLDAHELLSRVRSQLRSKRLADASGERLRLAEENRSTAQEVVSAVRQERRTVRVGSMVTVAVLIAAGLISAILYRRTQQQGSRRS
jgi:DNA-binding response OmpR family regulator